MTQDWQPFFDQKKITLDLDTEIISKLEKRLEEVNKGRRKAKLTLDHMISHLLIDMGDNPPKIEAVKVEPKKLEVTLYGLASENLETASEKLGVKAEEIIKHLAEGFEPAPKRPKRTRRSGTAEASL